MERKALISLIFVVLVASLSSLLFYETVMMNNTLGQLGLLGVFFAAFLSNLTVVGRDMFMPVFLPMTLLYNPLLLGAAAGWGGALGLVTTYYGGRTISEAVEKSNNEDRISEWIRRYGFLAIFIVAASPLPDTPVILLAGSSKFPLSKVIFLEGLGKTLWYTLGALVGGAVFGAMTDLMGSLLTSIVLVVASAVFCILVSWRKGREALFRWADRLRF